MVTLRPIGNWRGASRMTEDNLILAIGDMHLGTRCSGLPEELAGVDPKELTPAAALGRAVEFAIERQVSAVLLAGDVVESSNARFEAMAPLEQSVRRLVRRGIQVIAVAGNHDVDALPRLAALIDGFRLLGAGGRWEAVELEADGTPFAEVVGWSFGERHVRESPVAELLREPPPPGPALPRIGLLHCDLGASGGTYAPVRQSELDDAGLDAWLLGHIHKPSWQGLLATDGARPCGYLGSLVGLDPTETGPHGPWLVKAPAAGRVELEQAAIAPLRWERVDVPVDGIVDIEELGDRLADAAKEHFRELAQTGPVPRALGLRPRLTGSTAMVGDIRSWIDGAAWRSITRRVDNSVVFINKVIDAMQPLLDLDEIARGAGPDALLAQRLLRLEHGGERCANCCCAREGPPLAKCLPAAMRAEPHDPPAPRHRTPPRHPRQVRNRFRRTGHTSRFRPQRHRQVELVPRRGIPLLGGSRPVQADIGQRRIRIERRILASQAGGVQPTLEPWRR